VPQKQNPHPNEEVSGKRKSIAPPQKTAGPKSGEEYANKPCQCPKEENLKE